MFPVFNVSFHFLKLINTLVVLVSRSTNISSRISCIPFDNATNVGHKKQPFMTLRDTHAHTKLCHFNNGVCCGYDSKTKSRPASITISFKLFPHKNSTLVIMQVLAISSGRKWLSFMSSCDVT